MMGVQTLTNQNKIRIKAVTNKWITDNLNGERIHLSSSMPEYDPRDNSWIVNLQVKELGNRIVGKIQVDVNLKIVKHTMPITISRRLKKLLGGGKTELIISGLYRNTDYLMVMV